MDDLNPIAILADAAGEPAGLGASRRSRKPRRKAAPKPAAAATAAHEAIPQAEDVHQRIGHLTRTLHDALRELGYDKDLQATREHLPDARDRLSYIARVTGEAADKVLTAVDRARDRPARPLAGGCRVQRGRGRTRNACGSCTDR